MQFDIGQGAMEGTIGASNIDAELELSGTCAAFRAGSYTLPEPVKFQLHGKLLQDSDAGTRTLTDWELNNPGIELKLNGNFSEAGDVSSVDVRGEWKNGDPEYLRRLVPKENRASIDGYTLSGKSKGTFSYTGESSKTKNPVLQLKGSIDHAQVNRAGASDAALDLDCVFAYHSADPEYQHQSTLSLELAKKAMLGSDFNGKVHIRNFGAPVYSVTMDGSCPAALVNFVTAPALSFSEGEFDVESFSLQDFRTSGKMVDALFQHLECEFTPREVKGVYANNVIELDGGHCKATGDGIIEFALDDLQWDQLAAANVKGNCTNTGETLEFNVAGKSCGGVIETKGSLQTGSTRNTFRADWKVSGIEMNTLMTSFSNFDQTFITAENLSGKADIWAETVVPMTPAWEIRSREIEVKSAIIIRDGRLKNLKTLEDFSKYIHLEELRDIEFNELRNFLKVEDGKVYLPVMFIQSTAINMSIAGVHSFDQSILYNIKLNAGQALANKLKKTDFRKDLKPARKSGWLNLYFVLEGTTSNVRYQQYRAAVISGFEQSAALKEQLRKYMVDRFGYDVYWIEPNEWEDVPEYK
jgi:hypothetical protein